MMFAPFCGMERRLPEIEYGIRGSSVSSREMIISPFCSLSGSMWPENHGNSCQTLSLSFYWCKVIHKFYNNVTFFPFFRVWKMRQQFSSSFMATPCILQVVFGKECDLLSCPRLSPNPCSHGRGNYPRLCPKIISEGSPLSGCIL